MPSGTFWGFQTLNNNMLATVCIDLAGADPTRHELLEVCVLPLSAILEPHEFKFLFNMRFKPQYPDEIDFKECRLTRKEVSQAVLNSFDRFKIAELFHGWFLNLEMLRGKKLIPLGYNYPMTRQVLIDWLGYDTYSEIFSEDYRDVLVATHYYNDREDVRAIPATFSKQTLRWIAKQLNIPVIEQGGSCQADCLTIAQCYKGLLKK